MINELIHDLEKKREKFITSQNALLNAFDFKNTDYEKPLTFYPYGSYIRTKKDKNIFKILMEDEIWGDENYYITFEIEFFKIVDNYIFLETIHGEIIIVEQDF